MVIMNATDLAYITSAMEEARQAHERRGKRSKSPGQKAASAEICKRLRKLYSRLFRGIGPGLLVKPTPKIVIRSK